MNILKKPGLFSAFLLILAGLLAALSSTVVASEEDYFPFLLSDGSPPTGSATGDPLSLGRFASSSTDPTANIPWSCGFFGVDDIQCAFNNARVTENTQLGTSLPLLTLPSQAIWDGMSDGEKALWLINQERSDRGIDPLEQIEPDVTGVAQNYADYLLENNAWGHYENGLSPWERLNENTTILDCHDNLSVAENLAVLVSTGTIPLPVVRSVYMWMYDDAGSGWGHRHAILWYLYNDNSGTSGVEGFLGIGRASGGPYQGPFPDIWQFAEMIVMNVFDPCESWEYGSTTSSSTSSTTTTSASPSSTTSSATPSSTTTSVDPGTSTSTPSTSTTPPGMTTTTVQGSSTIPSSTTTSVEGDVFFECPSKHLYGDYSEEVYLLRKFRDDVLSATPEGKQLIDLYYKWSPLVLKAMVEDEELEDEIRKMLDGMLPRIKKVFGNHSSFPLPWGKGLG